MADKDYMGAEDDSLPPHVTPSHRTSTDFIISSYENKLNSNIAAKTLAAAKNGNPPSFTKEELAYLDKKANEILPNAEVKVITPAPTITLKKGNTELHIPNAAALVHKMEEMYPRGMSEDSREDVLRQPFIKASVKHDLQQEESQIPPTMTLPGEIKSVNKNAYEIRTDVLNMALDWTKFKKETNPQPTSASDDDVLSTAQKFYKFVENRR